MKPTLEPIQAGHIDLSRSQLQSPFALVQFLESGFNGIPTILDLVGSSPTNQSKRHSSTSTSLTSGKRRAESRSYSNTSGRSMSPIIGSPIELTQMKSPQSLDARVSSGNSVTKEMAFKHIISTEASSNQLTQPIRRQTLQRQNSLPIGESTSLISVLVSNFWSHVPAFLVLSAFVFDLPVSSETSMLPELSGLSRYQSAALSFTLCGVLLFWLAGCVMIVSIGFVLFKIASAFHEEVPGKTYRDWEWISPF